MARTCPRHVAIDTERGERKKNSDSTREKRKEREMRGEKISEKARNNSIHSILGRKRIKFPNSR